MQKILIVDDQAEVRELIEVTLRSDKYEIFQATNGIDAIESAIKINPILILMDIMMPGEIDGLEATRQIKANTDLNCKIVILTAKGQKKDMELGIEAGADSYFIKPFSPLQLLDKVEELIGW